MRISSRPNDWPQFFTTLMLSTYTYNLAMASLWVEYSPAPLTLSFTLWLTWTNEINRCDMSRGLKWVFQLVYLLVMKRTCHIYSADQGGWGESGGANSDPIYTLEANPVGISLDPVNLKSTHRHSSKPWLFLSHGVLGSSVTQPTVTAVWDRPR